MSRTDKDRPWWVVQHQENFLIDHDHRSGRCIEEDLSYARSYTAGSFRRWKHDCAKRVWVTEYCTKKEPHRSSYYRWSARSRYYEQTCWTLVCQCPIPKSWKNEPHDCVRVRVQCVGHKRVVRDETISCSCDDWPEVPTCSPGRRHDYRYTRGGSPSWYNRLNWYGPERSRERDELHELAREYNEYGELEDGDFENRQHRHEGVWNWW